MDDFKKGKKHTPDGQDVPQPYRYQLQPKKAKGKTNSVNA